MSDAAHTGEAAALLAAAEAAGVPVRQHAMREPEVIAAYQKRHVLVRPDGHVASVSYTHLTLPTILLV